MKKRYATGSQSSKITYRGNCRYFTPVVICSRFVSWSIRIFFGKGGLLFPQCTGKKKNSRPGWLYSKNRKPKNQVWLYENYYQFLRYGSTVFDESENFVVPMLYPAKKQKAPPSLKVLCLPEWAHLGKYRTIYWRIIMLYWILWMPRYSIYNFR